MTSRIRLEESKRNDISAQTLTAVLTESKSAKTSAELEAMLKRYGIDVGTFHRVAAYINTPSIDPATIVKTKNKQGEESQIMPVRSFALVSKYIC